MTRSKISALDKRTRANAPNLGEQLCRICFYLIQVGRTEQTRTSGRWLCQIWWTLIASAKAFPMSASVAVCYSNSHYFRCSKISQSKQEWRSGSARTSWTRSCRIQSYQGQGLFLFLSIFATMRIKTDVSARTGLRKKIDVTNILKMFTNLRHARRARNLSLSP